MSSTPRILDLGERLLKERLSSIGKVDQLAWVIIDGDDQITSAATSSRFRIASMTKSFTAAVVEAVAADYDALDFESPLHDFVPELSESLAGATIEHALSMTSGLPTDDAWADRLESMARDEFLELVSQPLITNQPPGVTYEYANLGYAILGLVVERVTGSAFQDLLDRYLLEPLELYDTSLFSSDLSVQGYHPRRDGTLTPIVPTTPGAFSPIGGLWSTARDVGRWMQLLRAARFTRLQGLAATKEQHILETLQHPRAFYQLEHDSEAVTARAYGYGLHYRWDSQLGEFLFHSGGYPGFGSHMHWHTSTGIGIALMGNRTYFPAEDIVRPVIEALVIEAGYEPYPRREKAATLALYPEVHTTTLENLDSFRVLLKEWDDDLASSILSPNMFQDYTRTELIEMFNEYNQKHLRTTEWLSRTEAILKPEHGSAQLQVLFNPLGQVQKLTWRNAKGDN